MASPRTAHDIVSEYLPDASEEERAALTAELKALAAALYQDWRTARRFDGSADGVVESDSPIPGI